jgi:hypothetical protein
MSGIGGDEGISWLSHRHGAGCTKAWSNHKAFSAGKKKPRGFSEAFQKVCISEILELRTREVVVRLRATLVDASVKDQ